VGDKIKTAIEIAMEKAESIGELSEEEKKKIEIDKKVSPILAKFFKGKFSPEKLYSSLKGLDGQVLKDTQIKILESITIGSEDEEMEHKKNGIIAVESLKEDKNMGIIEQYMNELLNIKKNFSNDKENAYNSLKMQIEQNPQARIREIKQGQKKVRVELTVEEAIEQNSQWKEFLQETEKKYLSEFNVFIGNLKEYLSAD